MAVCWRCPKCRQAFIYEGKKTCPKCGYDSSKAPRKSYFVEINYLGPDGKRKRTKRKVPIPNATLQDAKKFELELKQKLNNEPLLSKGDMLFVTFWEEEYLPHCEVNDSPSTLKRKKQIFNHWLKPYFGNKRLRQISRRMVEAFLVWRKKQPNKSPRGGPPSNNELRHELAVLKHALNLAKKWSYIPSNPAEGVSIKVEDPVTKWHFLSEEEIERLIKQLRPPVQYLVQLMAYTGLRFKDAANLKWSQVNFEEATITLTIKKTGNRLIIPLCEKALEALRKAREWLLRDREYVFINPDTKKPYTTLKRGFKAALRRAGLPENIRLHDLRHSFAKLAIDRGVPLQTLKELLGHQTIQATMVYTHVDLNNKRQAVEKLNAKEPDLKLIEGQGG